MVNRVGTQHIAGGIGVFWHREASGLPDSGDGGSCEEIRVNAKNANLARTRLLNF